MTAPQATEDFPLTIGVEEEFFLVDPATRDMLADPAPAILEACGQAGGPDKVTSEFLRSQIETNTRVCASIAEVRESLQDTRRIVVRAAETHGAAVLGASTHPFAAWDAQVPTPRDRYAEFVMTFQESLRRALVVGMHVHVGFGDEDARIRVMTAVRRHLPLLHALSGSSPFNDGRETGFKSYRPRVFGAMPRTNLPGPLWSMGEYEALLAEYRRMEFLHDGSELWWDIRPSHAFPTIELRVCDLCTRVEDAVSVAALFASLVRRLWREDVAGRLPPEPPTEIISENLWIAQRYGVLGFFGDAERGGRIDIEDFAARVVDWVADDARALDCVEEVGRVLDIVREGSGADRKLDHYRLRRLEGDAHDAALRSVVDLVVAETKEGL